MTRFTKSALLLGAAVAVLSACSGTKGPGEIGSKNDIIVRNNGLPGDKSQKVAPPDADFSSTVEQAEAVPAPSVESAQPLPDTSPAVEAAAQQVADAKAPVPSTATTTPVSTPSTEGNRIDQVVPATPVQDASTMAPPAQSAAVATPVAPAASAEQIPVQPYTPPTATPPAAAAAEIPVAATAPSSAYPAADYAAPAAPAPTAPAPAPATPSEHAYVPLPSGSAYPLDPNAPYSPKAVAASGVAASPSAQAPVSGGMNSPDTIRAAQTALKAKGAYGGAVTGTSDAAFLNALTIYQAQNNLPVGGLNAETLTNLGIAQ